MRLTNKHNLPGPVYSKVASTLRTKPPGWGVTTLIRPAHMVALEIKHWDDIETDAMDHVWRLAGTAIHDLLNVDHPDTILREHTVEMTTQGVTVRGQIDRLWRDGPANTLTDYKFTSQWSVIYGKNEWAQQLNMYGAMLAIGGYTADRLEVVAWLKDHSASKAQWDSQLPQTPIVQVRTEKWLPGMAEEFINARVAAHLTARNALLAEMPLPECTPEERWAKPDTWAVMKAGRKSALRVLPSNAEAEQWGQNNAGGKFTIEFRPGENTRCERYCPVSKFCDQFKQLKEAA